MNQKLRFLWGIHNSLSSFWAKLGYSRIKIDHIADSLLKLQIKIGVHLINVELSQFLTLTGANTQTTFRNNNFCVDKNKLAVMYFHKNLATETITLLSSTVMYVAKYSIVIKLHKFSCMFLKPNIFSPIWILIVLIY